MPRTKRASQWSVAEAREAREQMAASGLSVGEYAQRHGVDAVTLRVSEAIEASALARLVAALR